MKTLESRIEKSINLGRNYISRLKANVPKKYHNYRNTLLIYIVWIKFLSRGNIQISKNEKIHINVLKYLYLYFKLK